IPLSRASCRSSRTAGGISTLHTQTRRLGVSRSASTTACIVNAVLPAPGAPPRSATSPGPTSIRARSPTPIGYSVGGLPPSTSSPPPTRTPAAVRSRPPAMGPPPLPRRAVCQTTLDLAADLRRWQSAVEGHLRQEGVGEVGGAAELAEVGRGP